MESGHILHELPVDESAQDSDGRASYTRLHAIRLGYEVRYPELFARYPTADYIEQLDATPRNAPYHHLIPEVAGLWREILDGYGADALESYNRVVMLILMEVFDERAASRNYPESIIDRFRASFDRIERTIAEPTLGVYRHDSDAFLKDFAICRQKAIPVGGAHMVDTYSGFSRAALLSGGIGQFFRFLFLMLFVTRGNAPFYVTHTLPSEIEDFGPDGRDGCYARIAEMLERNPEIKGMYSASWFNDPALEQVSPRLAYLRQRPQENGAWVFRIGANIDGGALEKSPTRRKLHAEGSYVPTAYMVVWPRDKIIGWARQGRAGLAEGINTGLFEETQVLLGEASNR